MVKLPVPIACFMNLEVGGSTPLLGTGCFFITPRSCMVFCKTYYYQEMARIYPLNAHNSECQIFYFLTFSAKRSKFLERILVLTACTSSLQDIHSKHICQLNVSNIICRITILCVDQFLKFLLHQCIVAFLNLTNLPQ